MVSEYENKAKRVKRTPNLLRFANDFETLKKLETKNGTKSKIMTLNNIFCRVL